MLSRYFALSFSLCLSIIARTGNVMENLSNTIGYVGMEVEVSIGELWGNVAAV